MSPENLGQLRFDADRLERVGSAIRRDIDAGRCHGVALIVACHGQIALDLAEGYAERKSGRALKQDSVFATMSVAKQFTNVLALSLVERGLMRLHAPVADLLPEFRVLGKEKVNLFHLLTHTSGVLSQVPTVAPEVLTNIERLAGFAAALPLESQPGERVNYSIIVAHSVIGALCVRADGGRRTFTQMLEQEIFEPLRMRNTSVGVRKDLLERLCPIRAAWSGTGVLAPEAVEGMNLLLQVPGVELPGGGCVTTIADLHRFAEMLRRGGELDGARILSPAMIDYATRNYTGELRNVLFDSILSERGWNPFPAYIGLGFFVRGERLTPGPFGALNSPRTFGGLGAGSTAFWIDPERDLSFAFLSTGLMEDSHHIERVAMLSDLVISSIIE